MSTYREPAPRVEDAPTPASMEQIQLHGDTLDFYDNVSAQVFAELVTLYGDRQQAATIAAKADEAAVAMVIARERRRQQGIFF